MDIEALSRRFGVNAERRKKDGFPVFYSSVAGKRVLVLTDENTAAFSREATDGLRGAGCTVKEYTYLEREPVADEKTVARAMKEGADCDYLLAVGSGTLNDVAKCAGFRLGKPSGVFATAPSMDGYASGVTPLIENGFKITRPAQTASDVLMDADVLRNAPRIMIGAGVGDILAKHCCLTDWRISSYLTGEKYGKEAAELMYEALHACEACLPELIAGDGVGADRLMDALLVSGYAMVIAGNSRPASGAEHHMSHFLEMDFLRRGKPIPLHGVKVGLGTMVSLYLYHTLKDRPDFEKKELVIKEAEKLPSPERVKETLGAFGCPVRFSDLDVSADTVRRMLFEAYKIRDRFTILTLYCTRGFMDKAADEIMEIFY